jgi:hypothetical protein
LAKTQREQFMTPVGTAVYPHLHAPDSKFNKEGIYKVSLRFQGEDAEDVVALLEAQADAAYDLALQEYVDRASAKVRGAASKKARDKFASEAKDNVKRHVGYEIELDEDGEETDAILVEFKMKASGTNKKGERWERRPAIFDARGAAIAPGLKIGGGSLLKIAYSFGDPYCAKFGGSDTLLAGVPRYLNAVQVLRLETWAARDAGSFGFDVDEDGFSAEDAPDAAFTESFGNDPDGDDVDADEDFDDDGEESDF